MEAQPQLQVAAWNGWPMKDYSSLLRTLTSEHGITGASFAMWTGSELRPLSPCRALLGQRSQRSAILRENMRGLAHDDAADAFDVQPHWSVQRQRWSSRDFGLAQPRRHISTANGREPS